jgi:hypothetical protein
MSDNDRLFRLPFQRGHDDVRIRIEGRRRVVAGKINRDDAVPQRLERRC